MSNNRGRERGGGGRRGGKERRGGNATNSRGGGGGRGGGGYRYSSEEEVSSDDDYNCFHAIDDLVVSNTHITGAGKKTNSNLNHLLNFKAYAPRSNSTSFSANQPRLVKRSGRKQTNTFDKDRFVQANYRFIVKDRTGAYNKNVIDPDVGVEWDDIVQVHLSTDEPYLCPICLDVPTIPKMTKCGHIYCWSCMIRYLNDDGKKSWRRCPICFESVTATHLKSVEIESINEWSEGQMISFSLLQRARDSTIPIPRSHWTYSKSRSLAHYTNKDSIFSRLSLISDITPLFKKEQTAIETAIAVSQSTQDESLPYLAEAQSQLTQKYEEWVRENPPKGESNTEVVPEPRSVPVIQPEKQKEEEPEEESSDIWSEVGEVYELKRLVSATNADAKPQPTEGSNAKPTTKVLSEPAVPELKIEKTESKAPETTKKDSTPRESSKGDTTRPSTFTENVLFFQEEHGTLIFLHPLNVKMMLEEFASYERFPEVITGVILELEEQAVSEDFRKRYKYLRHLPISCSVLFCEIDLSKIVSERTMRLFSQQLRKRADKRQRERREKLSDSKSQSDSSIYEELHQMAVASGTSIPVAIPDFSSAPLPVASSVSPPSDSYAAIVGGVTSPATTTPVSTSPSASSSSSSTPSFADALRNSRQVPLGEEVLRAMAFVPSEKKSKKKKGQVFVLSNSGGRRYGGR